MFPIRHTLIATVAGVLLTGAVTYQNAFAEGMDVFGYAQAYCAYSKTIDPKPESALSTFKIQEMDLIFQKDLGANFSTLIDLQFLNNFSTESGWGDLNLDEVWIKYSPTKYFNVKFGHLVPAFASFNEIKTKFPLLPYINRPLIYESSLNALIHGDEYVPMHAALQINGTASAGAVKVDYTLFGGNSDFIVSNKEEGVLGFFVSGTDTTSFKLFGARLGLRAVGLKFGISGTYDKSKNSLANERIGSVNESIAQINTALGTSMPLIARLGATDRTRLGIDLSYSGFGFSFETEYIYVMNSPGDDDKEALDYLITFSTGGGTSSPMFSDDLTSQFFYANLTYDFLEDYFVTAGYSYLKNDFDLALQEFGIMGIGGGFGYRMSDNVTLKTQLMAVRNDLSETPLTKINTLTFSAGASVYF